MQEIKSPLRYPGGKSKAIGYLRPFFPQFSELREPFFGGGSVSFFASQTYKNLICYASDLNYELYCFWISLKNEPEKLINGVQEIYNNYANGKDLFDLLCARRELNKTELERGIDFYVLNRITFSGVVDSGGYSEGSFIGRFTQSSIDRLKSAFTIVKNINFYYDDYSYLLNKDGHNVFIFLDPPYYSATSSKLYGKNGHLHLNFDHEKFFNDLTKCEHKWLITYDNSEYIREKYASAGYYLHEWEFQYGMNNYKKAFSAKGKELIIANYDLELNSKSFRKENANYELFENL